MTLESGQPVVPLIHAREVLALRERLEEIYAEHTGEERERVHTDLERDRFFTPEEAVGYGLIDQILHDRAGSDGGRSRVGLSRQ